MKDKKDNLTILANHVTVYSRLELVEKMDNKYFQSV